MAEQWNSPTTFIALISLSLSVVGNVFQYRNLVKEEAKWELEKRTIEQNNYDLSVRLNAFLKKQEIENDRISELKEEIDSISREIEKTTNKYYETIGLTKMLMAKSLDPDADEEERLEAQYETEGLVESLKSLELEIKNLENLKKDKEAAYNTIFLK